MSRRRLVGLVATVSLAFTLGGAPVRAQTPVTAVATIDRNVIAIGDPIKLTIVVEVEDGWRVAPPPQLPRFGELTVLDTLPVLQGAPARGVTRYQFRFFVTSFDLGDRLLPAFEFEYSNAQGVTGDVRTTPQAIRVRSVIQLNEDASDIKPLKPQLELPGALRSRIFYWGTLSAAVGVVCVALLLVLRARRRRGAPALDLEHTPARETLRELERIAALRLPDKGQPDEHYALLAKAMRRYLLTQYAIPAEHRTARELYRDMEHAGIDHRQAAAIHEVLRESEAVRFQRAPRHTRHAQQAIASAVDALTKVVAAERPKIEVAS